MWPYAIRRILGAVPTLFIIIALTIFMMHIAPGGPFDAQRHLPPEIEHNVRAAYNLDKPVWEQFVIYVGNLLHGDLGPSYKNHDFTVSQLIAVGLPVSARLGFSAIVLAIVLGISLGTVAALNQNKATDYSVMGLAMIGITIPTFVTAPVLALIFGIWHGGFLFGGRHQWRLPGSATGVGPTVANAVSLANVVILCAVLWSAERNGPVTRVELRDESEPISSSGSAGCRPARRALGRSRRHRCAHRGARG